MENQFDTNSYLRSEALKQERSAEQKASGPFGWLKNYGSKLANNIDPLNLYARLKDYYKGIEIAAPLIADWAIKEKNHRDNPNWQEHDTIQKKAGATLQETMKDPNWVQDSQKKDTVFSNMAKFLRSYTAAKDIRNEQSPSSRMIRLKTEVMGDTAFTAVMSALSRFSGWAEKTQVERVYGKLAQIEFNKSESELSFKDLEKSKNPMLREAAKYYGKKSFIRSITDYAGLVRLLPLAIYTFQDKAGTADKNKFINKTNSGFGKLLHGIANFGNGIKALMFAKTFFFQWYFGSRQTGSFYEAKEIWNITEGISSSPNRALNENKMPGEFVTRQQIATLYERFREENPGMKLEQFTPDDPLASRVFEQTARYLNHTYMPKLFAISEPGKQHDLPRKNFTHSMLVELVGSGGLRVQDAMGSALRLEVMAYHGRHGVEAGIQKYREISEILEQVPHPNRKKHVTQDQAIEEVRSYLAKIDSIGREYLSDYWPPKYMNEELKEGFIKAVFQDVEISQEKIDYMASAMFMREQEKERTYRPKENDPASALLDTPKENQADAEREKQHRFADNISRKRPEDLLKQPTIESSTEVGPTIH